MYLTFAAFIDVFLIQRINYLDDFLKFASMQIINLELLTISINFYNTL